MAITAPSRKFVRPIPISPPALAPSAPASPSKPFGAIFGRSHRARLPKARLVEVINRSRAILGIPSEWRLGIVPASDTGAVEMALWSLLGARGVDILAFESFGEGWATDIVRQLKLPDARVLSAPYGKLPDLGQVDPARDVVFPLERHDLGRPGAGWRLDRRRSRGLTICDATSAAFAMALPWQKLDVVTWSWQKVLGGEAAHGMLALSPRAVERLESTPAWPLPEDLPPDRRGSCRGRLQGRDDQHAVDARVEDAIDGLRWAKRTAG